MAENKMMADVLNILNDVYDGNATLQDVVSTYAKYDCKKTYDWVQRGYALYKELKDSGYNMSRSGTEEVCNAEDNDAEYATSVKYDGNDNTYTYNKLINIIKGEKLTPETVMKRYGLDPNQWQCSSFSSSYRNTVRIDEDGTPIVCYNVRLTVKPVMQTTVTYEDIEEYFRNKNWNVKPPMEKFEINDSDDYLEIDLTDSHIGLLSYNLETLEDYDVQIATQRIKTLFYDVFQRCKGHKFKKIVIATLGDILHVDNLNNTTTKGTPQDVEGRITKWYGEALDMMVDCIDMILRLGSPIEYKYLLGNHDTATGSMLALSLKKVYEKNPNIEFDVRPLPQKIVVYGATLVGLCHGDQSKSATSTWLLNDYRDEFGKTRFAHIHCGHLHSESVKDDRGVLVYHLPSTCASSFWEKKQGYCAQRGMMCFVYNAVSGLRDIWYNYI